MAYIEIVGGRPLYGEITVQGSKNAVLPMLAACVLCQGTVRINGCPKIYDVFHMIKLLEHIGFVVYWEDNSVIIQGERITTHVMQEEYAQTMRSSIIMLGPMLGRVGSVDIAYPGGCSIGMRPIDIHLKALAKMNVLVEEGEQSLTCKTKQLLGEEIELSFPSVGATENVILAAVLAKGKTILHNAAKEPEIIELCSFLKKMGANICGEGTQTVEIVGVTALQGIEYTLMSDRIVAGTYLAAVAGCQGELVLHADCANQLEEVFETFQAMGAELTQSTNEIVCKMNKRPNAIDLLRTRPYPGFPTDMQSQVMAVLSIAKGSSLLIENIFENRFQIVSELEKMGANIAIEGRSACIYGETQLTGNTVYAPDLRGGAALVIAGLLAKGKTRLYNIDYIYRGYEDFIQSMKSVGANISRIE